ncbi:unnamed protein product [Prunus armeniaca]
MWDVTQLASSIEAEGSWTTMEDVLLCECWVQVDHYPIMGNEMKFSYMWRKIRLIRKWPWLVGGKF